MLPEVNILQVINSFKIFTSINHKFDEIRALKIARNHLKKEIIDVSDLIQLNELELMEIFQNPPEVIMDEIIEIIKTVDMIFSETNIATIQFRSNEISIYYETQRFLENIQRIIRGMDTNSLLIKSYRNGILNENDLRNICANEFEKDYNIKKEEVIRTDRPADLELIDKSNENFCVCAEFKFYDSLSISPIVELLDYRHSNNIMGVLFIFNRKSNFIFDENDYLEDIVKKREYLEVVHGIKFQCKRCGTQWRYLDQD